MTKHRKEALNRTVRVVTLFLISQLTIFKAPTVYVPNG
jgi:hypothetical protein